MRISSPRGLDAHLFATWQVYDTHLVPTWKRAGHFGHAAIDRANNLGVYSAMMLGMAPLLFDSAAADAHHRAALGDRLGAGRKLAETAGAKESDLSARALLDFARDQAQQQLPPLPPPQQQLLVVVPLLQ